MEEPLSTVTENVYRTTRAFEKKLGEGQESLQEMANAFRSLAAVLGSSAAQYTEADDETGNAHKLEKAAEFAAASGDVLSKMAGNLDCVVCFFIFVSTSLCLFSHKHFSFFLQQVAELNNVAKDFGTVLRLMRPSLMLSVIVPGAGQLDQDAESLAVEKTARSLSSVSRALKQFNEAVSTTLRVSDPTTNEAQHMLRKGGSKELPRTPPAIPPRPDTVVVTARALPRVPTPAIPRVTDKRKQKYRRRTSQIMKMVREHSSKFVSQLQLYEGLFSALSAPESMSPVQKSKKKREQVAEARENLLVVLADMAPEQAMQKFAEQLRGVKDVDGLCRVIREGMDTGTAADVLLSRMSFVDVIDVIEQFKSLSDGASASTPYLRRGVLRLGSFEQACVTYLQNRQKVLDALATAEKVSELKSVLTTFTGKNNVTPADLLEAPSKFLHGTLQCLNDLAMLDEDASEKDTQNVDIAYAAFKQFVIYYNRMDEALRIKNRISQFAQLEYVDFNKERIRVVVPGRRLLFQESVTFLGACDKKVSQGKGHFEVGGRLRRCGAKYILYVFSDVLLFVDSKDRAFMWPLNEVNVCEPVFKSATETDPSVFVLQDNITGMFNHFQCKRKGDVVSLVARVHTALATHKQNTVFGKQLSDVAGDANLSSDGVPRFVAHAVAWILANDMQVEGPFRKSASSQNVESDLIVIDHNILPFYSNHEPEAVLKRWLGQLPGRLVRFTGEWERAATGPNADVKLAGLLNTRVAPSERKIFALMVALAHCVVRHTAKTRLDFGSVSTVMAQNVFVISEEDVQKYTGCANDVFKAILVHSNTPEKFRTMFASLFVEPAFSLDSSLISSGFLGSSSIGTNTIGTVNTGTVTAGDPAGLTTSTIGVRRAVRDPFNSLQRSRLALVRAPPVVYVPKLGPAGVGAPAAPATPVDDAPQSPVPVHRSSDDGTDDDDEYDDDDYDDDDEEEDFRVDTHADA